MLIHALTLADSTRYALELGTPLYAHVLLDTLVLHLSDANVSSFQRRLHRNLNVSETISVQTTRHVLTIVAPRCAALPIAASTHAALPDNTEHVVLAFLDTKEMLTQAAIPVIFVTSFI